MELSAHESSHDGGSDCASVSRVRRSVEPGSTCVGREVEAWLLHCSGPCFGARGGSGSFGPPVLYLREGGGSSRSAGGAPAGTPADEAKEVNEGWLLMRDMGDLVRAIVCDCVRDMEGVCERGKGEIVLFGSPAGAAVDTRERDGEDECNRIKSRDGNWGGTGSWGGNDPACGTRARSGDTLRFDITEFARGGIDGLAGLADVRGGA